MSDLFAESESETMLPYLMSALLETFVPKPDLQVYPLLS